MDPAATINLVAQNLSGQNLRIGGPQKHTNSTYISNWDNQLTEPKQGIFLAR
jgi:hypothetical protein